MKTTLPNLLLAACILAASGCSPSEDAGRLLMEKRIQAQSQGKIRLIEFKKTNGVKDNVVYAMEYTALIQFMATGTWTRGSSMDSSVSFEFSPDRMPANNITQLMGATMGAVNVNQNDRQTVKGMLRFEKTEQCWRGEDGQIY